ncbi:MAG: DUF6282 family protein [bacterium]|jgi:hypothetical protein
MDNISKSLLDEVFRGAIDIHAHTGPCVFPRINDSIDCAKEAEEAGMRAIVLKNHHGITSDRATLVSKVVPGVEVYGGVCMNRYSGGINPYSVEAAMRMGGKFVWFPTQWAAHHIATYGRPQYFHMKVGIQYGVENARGISIVDNDGNLTPETMEVLGLVKQHNVAIGAGHLTKEEIVALFKGAKDMGIDKLVLQHVTLNELWDWSPAEQRELVELGALIEHVAIYIHPGRYLVSPARIAEMISWVGPENVVLSSDCGQLHNPSPVQGLQNLIARLLEEGVERADIDTMLKKNPARLLNLD